MNIADENQVKEKQRKFKDKRWQELEDIRGLLSLPEGRRFIWRMLEHAKVFGSIWEQSARIHYNAGLQDFGHFILGDVLEAKPDSLIQMMTENKKQEEENA